MREALVAVIVALFLTGCQTVSEYKDKAVSLVTKEDVAEAITEEKAEYNIGEICPDGPHFPTWESPPRVCSAIQVPALLCKYKQDLITLANTAKEDRWPAAELLIKAGACKTNQYGLAVVEIHEEVKPMREEGSKTLLAKGVEFNGDVWWVLLTMKADPAA